jgi:mycofactocin glycosyltransferase
MSVVNTPEHSDNATLRHQSAPQTSPPPGAFPSHGHITLDPATRLIPGSGGSTVLLGGSPLRLMKLTGKSETVVQLLAGGATLAEAATGANVSGKSVAALVDRLLSGQLAHPLWTSTEYQTDRVPNPVVATNLSTVTLVIPVKDRAVQLRRLLVSVQREVAEGLKVVVVDDGSIDASSLVAKEFGAAVVRHEIAQGPAAARNRGLVEVNTPFVAFVDSDCVCTYGWLPILLQHFEDPAVALVAPRIFGAINSAASPAPVAAPFTASVTTGSPTLGAYEAVRSPLDLGPAQARIVPRTRVSYVPSAALVARTDVVRALSGFATNLHVGEDVDLLWRLDEAGWCSRYEPTATVAHDHRVSWREFARRRFQYGTSAAILDQRHPGQVAPLAVSGWSALGWLGLCSLTPVGIVGGLGVMAVTTALLPRKLGVVDKPNKLALDLASRGHFGAGRQLADATWRAYLPLALAASFTPFLAPTARRVLAASAVIPHVLDWRSKHPKLDPLRYVGIRLLDDASYCAGVWAGAVRQRSFRALKPDFTSWPGKSNKLLKNPPATPAAL